MRLLISGSKLRGGKNTVEHNPLLKSLQLLCIKAIVQIDHVGEQVTDAESGTMSEEPLKIITSKAPRKPPLVPHARLIADLNFSSKLVIEPLCLLILPWLGVMTQGSPG